MRALRRQLSLFLDIATMTPLLPLRAEGANLEQERHGKRGEADMFHGQVEGTDLVVLDKRFGQLFAGYQRVDPPLDRLDVGRGACVVRGWALSHLV